MAKPDLVSRKTAAKLLGVLSPHITRLVDQGRMPKPVLVEGGRPVYRRAEVMKLAKELKKERRARERKRQKEVT